MPAAAVIPAPVAYINVAAVKKLVVGFVARGCLGPWLCSPGAGQLGGVWVNSLPTRPPPILSYWSVSSPTSKTRLL